MTVKQLKEELEKFDEDLPIRIDLFMGPSGCGQENQNLSLKSYNDENGKDVLSIYSII